MRGPSLEKESLVEEVHINTALDVTEDAEEGEIEKKGSGISG